MKIFEFKTEQLVPVDINTCWEFFSSPLNLQKITPENMNFKIISGADKKIFPGQIITYRVSPFKGVSFNWVTEITHMVKDVYFVDEQRFGPYAFWHHKHFFSEVEGGVLVQDHVHYAIPYGYLGVLINSLMIKNKVVEIFKVRGKALDEVFGGVKTVER